MIDYGNLSVAVVGDLIQDTWLEVSEVKESPEGGLDLINPQIISRRPGGAGNLAMNIKTLGAKCAIYGVAGAFGEWPVLSYFYGTEKISVVGLRRETGYKLPEKFRYMDGGKCIIRVSKEYMKPVGTDFVDLLVANVAKYDAVLIPDYNKGVMTKRNIEVIMSAAKAAGVPVTVDPKFENFWEYKEACIVKPNMKELLHQVEDLTDLSSARSALSCDHLVVTAGSDGIYISTYTHAYHAKAHKVKVVDACGAGDTVMAVLSLEYLRTGDIYKAVELANWAGALAVQKQYTATLTVEELWNKGGS